MSVRATAGSIAFRALFSGATAAMTLAGVPVTLLGPRVFRRYTRAWTQLFGLLTRALIGIRLEVEGTIPDGPALFAAKHESEYETMALFALIGDPVVVLKRELTEIPVLGRLMRHHGAIPVDRTANASALRGMLRAADVAKASGRSVLIFPEGTRVAPGERVPAAAGFAGLYARLGLPVVPVATDAGRVWPKGIVKRPGTIRLRFGDPIPAGLPRRTIEARTIAAINAFND